MLNENFVGLLVASMKNNWDRPAFSNYDESPLSYGEVAKKVLWLHQLFRVSHIKKGDKIALIGKNSSFWALTYLSIITYGAVVVPVLVDFHTDDFHHIVNHSDSRLLFAADNIYDQVDEVKMPHLEAIFSLKDFRLFYSKKKNFTKGIEKADEYLETINDQFGGLLTAEKFDLPEVPNNELAGIVYTSGTSGFSKGVMLPHNSLIANVRFAAANIPLKAGDTILSFLPMAHTFGCAFDFLFPFSIGGHITFLGRIPSPKILIQALSRVRPRLILSVPLLIEKIYKSRIKKEISKKPVRILSKVPVLGGVIKKKIRKKLVDVFGGNFIEIVIGGAALNDEVEQFLHDIGFPFTVGYGMTECGPLISYKSWPHNQLFAVGQLVDTLEIRIDPSVTDGGSGGEGGSGVDVTGEILVRGENVMLGYYKNEEATEETIDADGWLHTGDIGSIDKKGFIYIKGRYKNMLLGASGQNIYPEEIETRLNNMPFVSESLVMERGKNLVALVYPDMELMDSEGLGEQELANKMKINRQLLNEQLPVYSRIAEIELFPQEFEKTPTKKIKRFLYTAQNQAS